MTRLTALCIVRRVEVGRDRSLGVDYVTVGVLKHGNHKTRNPHWWLVSESAPLTEREARKRIEASHGC